MNIPIFSYILIKLATRCNINCSYCYWFRDEEVYSKPPLLTPEAEQQFLRVLEDHILQHDLDTFTTLFHGGEPLLFPKRRFSELLHQLSEISDRTGCKIDPIVTTNGMLVDEGWATLFKRFNVGVSISIDGPAVYHDRYRVDHKGRGSYDDTVRGLRILQSHGVGPGVIAVCDPSTDPEPVITHIVDDLKVRTLDILPPDYNHDNNPAQIGNYFNTLFDIWFVKYAKDGIRLRVLDGIVQGLAGNAPVTDSCGYGPVHTLTLLTDGSLEPLDVLRIRGDGSTSTDMNVFENKFQDVMHDPVWMEAFDASLNLCTTCRKCEFLDPCGGGHLAHRWSSERGYDNPSVYCESWKSIFTHAWSRISPTLYFSDTSADSGR